jgi:hypothetical protein
MQTHLKSRQQQRQSYRDDFPGAARVDDSVAADFDDSKSKKRVNTPRLFFWWRKAKKSRDVVALSIVFLLTFFLSYSLTSSSSSSSFESNSFGPAVQRGLALRKKFAEQSAASSNHAYRYSNSHHALEYSTRRQLLATAYPEINEISPPVTTCSATGESYVVQGADTAGDFGTRMCCSSYYATEVTFCGYTTTAPSFEYAMHVTSGRTSTTSISSGATETGEGDCKTYDTSAAPAKICVYTECQTTDMADCTFSEEGGHSVTFTHAPWPSPPPTPSPPPAQAAVDATMELTGYSAAEFGEAQKTAFKKGMAAYLNVGADAITVKSVIDVVDASRRKLQAATDKVKIEFTVETTTYADISDVEEKLVTEDSTKLNEMVTTLSAQADLTVTAVTAPVSLTKLAPPPSPPPEAQTIISGAIPRLTRLLSIVSLLCAVSMTYVL